ncbi:hypothetical protein DC22_17595 [Escherichia coli]|nr:hypothetical protein SB521682_5315 [Shigella boydii 5216-82]KDM86094.1 hypothetical protein DC22_17595 [Escherichia coli]KXR45045.1 hypothetical protein AUQ27_04200 [Escherichia coli]
MLSLVLTGEKSGINFQALISKKEVFMKEKLTIDQKIEIARIAVQMFESTRAKGVSLEISCSGKASVEENTFNAFYKIVEKTVIGEPENN